MCKNEKEILEWSSALASPTTDKTIPKTGERGVPISGTILQQSESEVPLTLTASVGWSTRYKKRR